MDDLKRKIDLEEVLDPLNTLQKVILEFQTVSRNCVESLDGAADRASKIYVALKKAVKNLELLDLVKTGNLTSDTGTPFVVILIDANALTGQFRDEDIRANGRGGREVAQRLNFEVQQYIHSAPEIPQDIRVVIRIYADLKDVSLAAIRAKLVDPNSQPRALAPFVSAFNEVNPWFDFVDTGNKQITKIKIQENFQMFVDDPNCKQIIFGVGPTPIYVDLVARYRVKVGKVVLLRIGQVVSEYEELDLKMIEFPQVFRSSDASELASPSMSVPFLARDSNGTLRQFDPNGSKKSGGTGSRNSLSTGSALIANGNDHNPYRLPFPESAPSGLIPLNTANERIDMYMQKPGPREKAACKAGLAWKKPCAAYHLKHNCTRPNCPFDHTAISLAGIHCLEYQMKGIPCNKGSQCRTLNCIYGHVCQGCKGRKKSGCKMPVWAHSKDLNVDRWIDPDEHPLCDDGLEVNELSDPHDDGSWGRPQHWRAAGSGDAMADLINLDD